MKHCMPPPFPQALKSKKKASQQTGILEVLRRVKVNIPLLDIIKQVPAYAKFLKDLCTIKKGLGIEKKAFLTEQVSAIIKSKNPVKYKDPGSPTISVNIGGTCIDKALLDLGASVNLLPYSLYKHLGLGELKPTNITLSLADRSVKIPKGIVEDVLVKVDKFYYPVDFVVLDTEPIANGLNHVPIILGRPFLATANAIINCRNGVMQLTFRAVHRSKTGPDRTGTGLDRNRNHVFWRTGDRTGIIPVQTCPDLFIQVRSGFGPVWTCFVFFNICSLKSQNLHNKFSS